MEGLDDYERNILNDTTVRNIRERISDQRTQDVSAYNPCGLESRDTYARKETPKFPNIANRLRPGTSHIAAADNSGLAISLTTTINLIFGGRVMVPETGIVMNNEMNGASHFFYFHHH